MGLERLKGGLRTLIKVAVDRSMTEAQAKRRWQEKSPSVVVRKERAKKGGGK